MACALNSLKKLIDFKGDVETEANKSLIDSLEKEIRRLKRELVEKDFQLNGKDAAFDSYRKTVEEQKLEDLMKEEVELEDGSYIETPEQVSLHDQPQDRATTGMEVQVASVVYRVDDFPELKKKIDRAVSNIELYGSDRYNHMKQVILKHESKILTRVNALDRDQTSGRLSVRTDPEIIRLKERYSQKIHILQEALNRFRTLDRQLKSEGKKISPKTKGATLVENYTSTLPPNDPLTAIANTQKEVFTYSGYLKDYKKSGFGVLRYENGSLFAIGEWKSDRLQGNPTWIFHRNSQILYSGFTSGSLRDGYGKTFYNNGEKCCKGVWARDHGNCEKFEFYYINGQVKYMGSVRNGVYDGIGSLWWPNGGVRYEG
jgi:antitoxin component YwqK of YwqJK toxin-antitoxin module